MSNHAHAVRNAFVTGAALFSFLIVSGESWAQTDCPTELASPVGFTVLNNSSSTTQQRKVDEWEGEVIRLTTTLPGVLTIEGDGPGLQSALYSGSGAEVLDSAQVGTGLPGLQVIVPAGDHCIEVTSGVGEDDFEVKAAFTDVCHLGDADDHGDSSLCATLVELDGESVSGQISSFSTTDIDRFKFYLSSPTEVVIASTGSTDVEATLYAANGTPGPSDDDSGVGGINFEITESLPAGWHYFRVMGANGSYSVSVTTAP